MAASITLLRVGPRRCSLRRNEIHVVELVFLGVISAAPTAPVGGLFGLLNSSLLLAQETFEHPDSFSSYLSSPPSPSPSYHLDLRRYDHPQRRRSACAPRPNSHHPTRQIPRSRSHPRPIHRPRPTHPRPHLLPLPPHRPTLTRTTMGLHA